MTAAILKHREAVRDRVLVARLAKPQTIAPKPRPVQPRRKADDVTLDLRWNLLIAQVRS